LAGKGSEVKIKKKKKKAYDRAPELPLYPPPNPSSDLIRHLAHSVPDSPFCELGLDVCTVPKCGESSDPR